MVVSISFQVHLEVYAFSMGDTDTYNVPQENKGGHVFLCEGAFHGRVTFNTSFRTESEFSKGWGKGGCNIQRLADL